MCLQLNWCVFVCGPTRPEGLLRRCIGGCGGRPGSSECGNVWSAHCRSPSGSNLWNSPALPPCCLKHTHTDTLLLLPIPPVLSIHVPYQGTTSCSEKWSQCWSTLNLHSFHWPAGATRLVASLWKKELNSHLIYSLSKLVPKYFMVSVSSFKSSSIQHDVHLVNYGPI